MLRHLRSGAAALAILAACGATVSGCGKKTGEVSGQAENPAAFASQAQKLLKELPDSERANVIAAHEKLAASENERFASLLERYRDGRDPRNVADYIDDVSSGADSDKQRIAAVDADIEQARKSSGAKQYKEYTESRIRNSNVEKAGRLLALSLRLDLLKKAIALDPILSEAVKARAGQTPTENGKKEPLSDVVQRLAMMPCRNASAQAGEAGRFSARGVALGMTREQALAGVCASEKGAVMFADYSPFAPYDGQPYKHDSDLPANPLAWADYRAGKVPALNREKDLEAWAAAAVAKPRPMPLDLCFGCEKDQDRGKARAFDGLFARFAPDGRIYHISKTQEFSQKLPFGEQSFEIKPMPQPSKNVLGPLTSKFGTPSVVYESGWYTMVAWVYRDRANLLPTESWYVGNGVSNNGILRFKNDTFLPVEPRAAKDALIKAKPVATYCMTRVVPPFVKWFGYSPPDFDSFLEYVNAQGIMSVLGQEPTNFPYVPKWEAAGYVPNCGVVVTATLWHMPPNRADRDPPPVKKSSNPKAPDADTPIYYVDLQIVDVDAREKMTLDEATAAVQYRTTKTAAAAQEQKDFNAANAYRP
ncbi:hypothetical protein [Phenylobacterium sp.]|uniref:hypothetical protein n=1 Tax=Phenylobacterium sp. TaxID=1871053 RepID=UPI002897AE08|nr:hypothetical protein [Phenylobacterium sp.]